MSAVFMFRFLPANFSEDWETELLMKHRDKFWTRWEEMNVAMNLNENFPTVTIGGKQQTIR